jgi:hypothetical protein
MLINFPEEHIQIILDTEGNVYDSDLTEEQIADLTAQIFESEIGSRFENAVSYADADRSLVPDADTLRALKDKVQYMIDNILS